MSATEVTCYKLKKDFYELYSQVLQAKESVEINIKRKKCDLCKDRDNLCSVSKISNGYTNHAIENVLRKFI